MSVFQFSPEDMYSFFAVLVRFSVATAILPFFGDSLVPGPIKILFSLAITLVVYPILVSTGIIVPTDSLIWAATAAGVIQTISLEAVFGLSLGFFIRILFAVFQIGSEITGTFMGFASASQFDPQQESQAQVVSRFHMAIAMLIFMVLDGHHIVLRGVLDSYRYVGIGGTKISGNFIEQLILASGQTLRTGFQIAAPIAISFFSVNVVYGVMAKAMPQLNILILSFSVSALIGLAVLLFSLEEFHDLAGGVFEKMGGQLQTVMVTLGGR